MKKGTVKWFNNRRGYGFITGEDGEEVFFHFSSIVKDGFKTVKTGSTVTFNVDTDESGRTVAKDVTEVAA